MKNSLATARYLLEIDLTGVVTYKITTAPKAKMFYTFWDKVKAKFGFEPVNYIVVFYWYVNGKVYNTVVELNLFTKFGGDLEKLRESFINPTALKFKAAYRKDHNMNGEI
mgnify:CR=1 FL=1